jgi:hypothetical protein
MKTVEKSCVVFLTILFLVAWSMVDGHRQVLAQNPELSSVVFYVQ